MPEERREVYWTRVGVGGKVSFSKPESDFVYTPGLCTTTTLSRYSAKKVKIQKGSVQKMFILHEADISYYHSYISLKVSHVFVNCLPALNTEYYTLTTEHHKMHFSLTCMKTKRTRYYQGRLGLEDCHFHNLTTKKTYNSCIIFRCQL